MNPILDAMKFHHSIRDAKREDLEKIIEAGLYAARSHGMQFSMIVAITDKILRDQLMEMNRKIGSGRKDLIPFTAHWSSCWCWLIIATITMSTTSAYPWETCCSPLTRWVWEVTGSTVPERI